MELYEIREYKVLEPMAVMPKGDYGWDVELTTTIIAETMRYAKADAEIMANHFVSEATRNRDEGRMETLVNLLPDYPVAIACNETHMTVFAVRLKRVAEASEKFLADYEALSIYEDFRDTLPEEWQKMMLDPDTDKTCGN